MPVQDPVQIKRRNIDYMCPILDWVKPENITACEEAGLKMWTPIIVSTGLDVPWMAGTRGSMIGFIARAMEELVTRAGYSVPAALPVVVKRVAAGFVNGEDQPIQQSFYNIGVGFLLVLTNEISPTS